MVTLIAADAMHADLLAALHGACFPDEAWRADAMRSILTVPLSFGSIALDPADQPSGFLLARHVATEAEILTLGVLPASRRTGMARALLADFLDSARRRGARHAFLEVAEDNDAALALYTAAGFAAIGRRPAYYRGKQGARAALTLRLELAPHKDSAHTA
jgi:ribosomal-protein-alanine N-acetyltransferase